MTKLRENWWVVAFWVVLVGGVAMSAKCAKVSSVEWGWQESNGDWKCQGSGKQHCWVAYEVERYKVQGAIPYQGGAAIYEKLVTRTTAIYCPSCNTKRVIDPDKVRVER